VTLHRATTFPFRILHPRKDLASPSMKHRLINSTVFFVFSGTGAVPLTAPTHLTGYACVSSRSTSSPILLTTKLAFSTLSRSTTKATTTYLNAAYSAKVILQQ
jgi:hypothetical protein